MFVSIVNVKPGDEFRFMSISGDIIQRRVMATAPADPEYALSWKDRAHMIAVHDGVDTTVPLFYSADALVVEVGKRWYDNSPAWNTVWEVTYPSAHFAEMDSE